MCERERVCERESEREKDSDDEWEGRWQGAVGDDSSVVAEDGSETEVFDAETETRVVRLVLGLGLVWRMGDGRMEQESERDIEAMETESEDR